MTPCATTVSSQFDLSLAHQGMFSVVDAAGLQMTCRKGNLWITLDNDPRDVVLSAGESFLTTQHRRAIIYAIGPSSLSLAPITAGGTPRRAAASGRAASPRWTLALQAL